VLHGFVQLCRPLCDRQDLMHPGGRCSFVILAKEGSVGLPAPAGSAVDSGGP
jgi:hypothetical protein